VVGFFDPANTDTLEYVFDINSNGIQISLHPGSRFCLPKAVFQPMLSH